MIGNICPLLINQYWRDMKVALFPWYPFLHCLSMVRLCTFYLTAIHVAQVSYLQYFLNGIFSATITFHMLLLIVRESPPHMLWPFACYQHNWKSSRNWTYLYIFYFFIARLVHLTNNSLQFNNARTKPCTDK